MFSAMKGSGSESAARAEGTAGRGTVSNRKQRRVMFVDVQPTRTHAVSLFAADFRELLRIVDWIWSDLNLFDGFLTF